MRASAAELAIVHQARAGLSVLRRTRDDRRRLVRPQRVRAALATEVAHEHLARVKRASLDEQVVEEAPRSLVPDAPSERPDQMHREAVRCVGPLRPARVAAARATQMCGEFIL